MSCGEADDSGMEKQAAVERWGAFQIGHCGVAHFGLEKSNYPYNCRLIWGGDSGYSKIEHQQAIGGIVRSLGSPESFLGLGTHTQKRNKQ